MTNKISYWVEMSDYDMDTADAMFISGRYLYVGFMCHQAIEKILKAFFVSNFDETPPFSHSLSLLSKKSNLYSFFSETQKEFLDQLEPLNIEARYPSHKEQLLKSLTPEKCQYLLDNSKSMQKWIKTKLY